MELLLLLLLLLLVIVRLFLCTVGLAKEEECIGLREDEVETGEEDGEKFVDVRPEEDTKEEA